MSLIQITQVIKTAVGVTLPAVSGKIQRVVNTGAGAITITMTGGSTFSVPSGKVVDFWYDAGWYYNSSDLFSTNAVLNSLTVDTNTLVVDSVNHRVGVKTIEPKSIFHVTAITDTAGEGITGGAESQPYFAFRTANTGSQALAIDVYNGVNAWIPSAMSILTNGNSGFGTSDPGANKLKVDGTGASYSVYAVGDAYFTANVSALSFTDRTPHFEGDALAEIMLIKGVNGEIDHNTLPAFARVEKTIKNKVPKTVEKPKKASKIKDDITVDEMIEYIETEEIVQERDLGAMISIHTVAIQQIVEKLNKLESKK